MAEQYHGFWDGGALYGEVEFNRYFDRLYESGVAVRDSGVMEYEVTKQDASTLKIAGDSFAIVRGYYLYTPSDRTLSVPAGNRKDRVVIKMDKNAKSVTFYLKQGSASAPPTLQRDTYVWEISLAQISVTTAGVQSVTNERTNQTLCGALRPKNLSEFNDWMEEIQQEANDQLTEIQNRFDEWFESTQGKAPREIYLQATEPSSPAEGAIWI